MSGASAGRPGPEGGDPPTGRSRPRRAPPWWPDDEPWPPSGPADWHRARGRGRPPGSLALRLGCAFVVFGFLFLSALATILWLAAGALGEPGPTGPPAGLVHLARLAGGAVLLIVIVALVTAGRSLRGGARTLDDLTAAAERVEAGDYGVRVAPPTSGPRELREFARRFDTMVARLASDEERRRALLADVSHELRTPLAVVRGNVEAIVDGVHPADPDHLRAILDETDLMARLIEDLRTVSLSEAGTLSLHREPTDLETLLDDVARAFGPAAARSGIELSQEVAGPLPTLEVDPVRTREVVENLVENAIRHTPSGGRVRLSAVPVGDQVEVAVEDTGPGIDPGLLPTLFDRFTKSPGSGGSGLGLAIARQLVLAHGGTISAESPPGSGTTIRFRLPVDGGRGSGPRGPDPGREPAR